MSVAHPTLRRTLWSGTAIGFAWIIALVCAGCFDAKTPGDSRPSVLLITVDTLRADHLGAWGQPLPTSPRIDSLVARGARFADATVQWPKTWPSIASLLTGTYPRTSGLKLEHRRIADEHLMLAEIFRSSGYRTGAVVANFNVGRKFGFDQGFDEFVESWQDAFAGESPGASFVNRAGRVKQYANATIVTEQALRWLDTLDGEAPYFLWVHYMDPHGPYRPPEAYASLFVDAFAEEPIELASIPRYQRQNDPTTGNVITDLGDYRARYAREVRYLDGEIGRLLDRVEAPNPEHSAPIVALTADHGESLNEQNYYLEHGRFAYQSTAHVPLAIVQQGQIQPGQLFEQPVGVIDLSPTLLELAGIPVPMDFEGHSLRQLVETGDPAGSPEFVFMEAGYEQPTQLVIRSGRWKLVHVRSPEDRHAMRNQEFELYDVHADPGEKVDLSAKESAVVDELRTQLADWVGQDGSGSRSQSIDLKQLDAREQEMLRALGYLE